MSELLRHPPPHHLRRRPHSSEGSLNPTGMGLCKYRLLPVTQHRTLIGSILSMLASAPNHPTEAAFNAVVLHRFAEVFGHLREMPPVERSALIDKFARFIEIHVRLDEFKDLLDLNTYRSALHKTHLDQCRRLITQGAGNSMIQRLCFALCDDDIRGARLDLNRPVNKGRCKSLPLDDKLSVLDCWQALCADTTDEFDCWQRLAAQYPAYDMAQLYAAVNDAASGGIK